MRFRSMTSNDMEHIIMFEREMRIEEPDIHDEFIEEEFKANFSARKMEEEEGYNTILCFEDEHVIGRIDLIVEQSFMDFKKVGYVDWVYVLPSFRNKGIAKTLFLLAEEYFISTDCSLYYLFVAETEVAKRFYNSIGIEIKPILRASKTFKK